MSASRTEPTLLPRFDVTALTTLTSLGKGRQGCTVNLCRDSDGSLYAVKCVPRLSLTQAGAAASLLREKEILQALNGRVGIVSLLGTWKDDDHLYFILEAVLAGPLHKHVRSSAGGRLSFVQCKWYTAEIACGVVCMHRHGIMHRDLKASNIMLDATGHIKIIDLSCAKRSSSDELSYTFCGTTHSMAPEMLAKNGHTKAVDWWALGILIHEMLVGKPPFGYAGEVGIETVEQAILNSRDFGLELATLQSHLNCENAEHGDAAHAMDLMNKLIVYNPNQRLGSAKVDEVLEHAWFFRIDMEKLAAHELQPPRFRKDLGAMDFAGLDVSSDDEENDRNGPKVDQTLFKDF